MKHSQSVCCVYIFKYRYYVLTITQLIVQNEELISRGPLYWKYTPVSHLGGGGGAATPKTPFFELGPHIRTPFSGCARSEHPPPPPPFSLPEHTPTG